MADLAKLEEKFRDAQAAFMEDDSESNKKKYKKAKEAFSEARTAQKEAEEADPDHPRGKSLAAVIDEES